MLARACLLMMLLGGGVASAAENLPAGDQRWEALQDAIDKLTITDPLGGVRSMDEARVDQLFTGKQMP